MSNNSDLKAAVIQGKPDLVEVQVTTALQSGQNANSILEELIAGVREVGDLFSAGEYFLPDLLLGAKAMKAGLTLLEPELAKQSDDSQIKKQRKILLGTVKGDLHDIGKSLVGLMFEINGYDVKDLGVDVSADQFIVEAIFLSFLGGMVGIVVGFTLTKIISIYAGWETLVSGFAIALSFGVSASVGIIFGFYPAMKAAKLDPIESLRYE